jgi:hypothetical protein
LKNTYDAYVGRYRFDDGFMITISEEGNNPKDGNNLSDGNNFNGGAKLFIQFGNDTHKIELLPISATEFTAADIPDVITFERNAQGQVKHILDNVDEIGKKIE